MDVDRTLTENEISHFVKNTAPRTIKVKALKAVGLSGPGSLRDKMKAPGVVFMVNDEEAARLIRIGAAERVKESAKLTSPDDTEAAWKKHQKAIRDAEAERKRIEKELREGSKG